MLVGGVSGGGGGGGSSGDYTYFLPGSSVSVARNGAFNLMNLGEANRLYLSPMVLSRDVTVDLAMLEVTTIDALSTARMVVYDSDANGMPTSILFESGDLSTIASGDLSQAFNFTFAAAKPYWVGALASSATPGFRSMSYYGLPCLFASAGFKTPATAFRKVVTNPLPNPLPYTANDFVNTDVPLVRFRVV